MPQPPAYIRTSNLTEYATANPAAPYPPASVDAEFNNIVATLAQTLANLALLQRDDGAPRNASIPAEALGPSALLLIGSAGFTIANPVGWLTGTAYPARQIVTEGGATYVCAVSHTAGVFATDLAAGRWVLLFSAVSVAASAVTFTPTGTVAASNAQAAIAEVALEAMQKAANLSDVADQQTAINNLFSGAARRFWADYSDATVTNRAAFQSSVTNGVTTIPLFPNGTSQTSGFTFESSAGNPANSSVGVVRMSGGNEFLVQSTQRGSGGVLPLVLLAQNARLSLDPTSGNLAAGVGLNVPGIRNLNVVNGDAGAGSGAAVYAQSNAGLIGMSAYSTALGAFAEIGGTFANGVQVKSYTGPLQLLSAGGGYTIRADGSVWTDSNARPVFQCRAWARVNGVTPGITAGGNFASVTDLGSAQLRLTFTTPMPDANYSVGLSVRIPSVSNNAAVVLLDTGAYTNTHFDIKTHGSTNLAVLAADIIGVQVFR